MLPKNVRSLSDADSWRIKQRLRRRRCLPYIYLRVAAVFKFLNRCCLTTFYILLLSLVGATAIADELPAVSDRKPVPMPHFPDRLHAFVWRNWQLVEPARMAAVLGTTADKVTEIATSMGLPRQVSVPQEIHDRGYITVIRRNWHLLPFDQLTQLLDITPSELAFRLREDDVLFVKLGQFKPKCERLVYTKPTEAAEKRAAEIKQIVAREFGERLSQPGEPRFAFVRALSHTDGPPPAAATHGSNEHPRYIYSYFALFGDPLLDPKLDPFPDGLLARLHAQGVNGVWLHVVLRQLAPGGSEFPEFGEGHQVRLANLRKLVARAKRYGIDVYLYMNEPRAMPKAFFDQRPEMAGVHEGDYVAMCTSNPRVRQWVSDSLTYVFKEVPDLGGVFTITASENLTNCASHNQRANCPHCKHRTESEIEAEMVTAIADGVHRAAPNAKVLAWDWGWSNFGDASHTIKQLPKSVWLLSVSEWSLPIERGGIKTAVGEYSISSVGPGPRATRHWQVARERGMQCAAKVQLNNTWELSSVPYIPGMDLVAEHCERLGKANVDGMMLSWSLGGYPSMNLDIAQQFASRPMPSKEVALQRVAERHFGAKAAPLVRQAWSKFSQAFREYPYSGAVLYNAPQQMGPANLLYGEPTGYSATMVGIPYDDLNGWRGEYPAEVFVKQFQKVADGWATGIADLEAAQKLVPTDQKAEAVADLRVAKATHLHFASVANQTRYVMARDALRKSLGKDNVTQQKKQIASLLDSEIELAQKMFELASADSRLGYEAANHYFYVPLDLVEKVVDCEYLKQQLNK